MAMLRRLLLLLAFALAFGGFTFYAGVVVPIGGRVLGSTTQGFVTRQVTHAINAMTAIMVVLFAWNIVAQWGHRGSVLNRVLAAAATIVGLCCLALVLLHSNLDSYLIERDLAVNDPERFYGVHRAYLWVSMLQWVAMMPLAWCIVSDTHQAR